MLKPYTTMSPPESKGYAYGTKAGMGSNYIRDRQKDGMKHLESEGTTCGMKAGLKNQHITINLAFRSSKKKMMV